VVFVADILITERIYSDIVGHCRTEWPKEACGALFGEIASTANDTTMRITGSLALANVARDPHHYFQIDPREWISLLSRAGELDGECFGDFSDKPSQQPKLAGIYHSHPRTPSVPSAEDLDTAWRRLPCFLIVSLQRPDKPDVRAFGFDKSTPLHREYEMIKL
jgi:proteasome lid subunit RPN8/RPN11